MKVLFDVSSLGSAQIAVIARAGIFRVVENIALGLKKADSCDVTLCSSLRNFSACQEYLRINHPFQEVKFSVPDNLFSSMYTFVEPLRTEIAKLPKQSWKTPLRKVYRFGEQFLHPLHKRDIRNADIYHSPVHPIPAQVNNDARIVKFITIHDLIPLVCPDHRSPSCIVSMKRILGSIKPDTHIFCVSGSTRNDLLNHMPFLDRERISVVHLAAGAHFYPCLDFRAMAAVKKKYAIPPDGDYLLALSTLQPRKNFDRVIKSFVRLLREERIKDLRLVLVGAEGWEFQEIYKEIENAGGLGDRIILTGFVPDEDLAPLYSGAMAFVYPSLYEGFGLPPLEAMQCGTPVITSNNSSIPEVVGNAALTINPRDGDALCQAMLDIYRSAELRRELSALAIARASEFSWQKTTEQTLVAYQHALQMR
jgi:glycosyltransferase involved in cell wall biosynthesis